MDSYLLIDREDRAVNLIVWNGENYVPPMGTRAVKYAGPWGTGWKWDGTRCIDPNPPPPPAPPPPPPPAAPAPSGIKVI